MIGIPNRYKFGLSLENLVAETLAQGIDIRIECCWRGNNIHSAPRFDLVGNSEGWKIYNHILTCDQPAVLAFHGTYRDRCSYNHPLEWNNFVVVLSEKINGYFLLIYHVTSAQPKSRSSGELSIVMK